MHAYRFARLLLPLLVLAAAPARAEDPVAAADRLAPALAETVLKKVGGVRPSLALAPAKEPAAGPSGVGRVFLDRLAASLAEGGRLRVLDWQAVDKASRERLLGAVAGGALSLPPVPDLQALVVTEVTGGGDGTARLSLRVVALPAGNVLAAESLKLDTPRAAAGASGKAESVDVVVRRLADLLAVGLSKLPGGGRYQRLAVLPLQEVGPEATRRELGTVVMAELATDLRQYHGLLLVERARLGAVMAEMKLGEMGLTSAKDAPRLGHLVDAQALVVGSVSDAGDRFLVNARIVATGSAETLASASVAVEAASLIALSADAVVLRSRQDAVFRSMVVPGWGQAYNRQPVKAGVVGGLAAAALGGALWFQLSGSQAERDYQRKVTPGALGGDPSAEAVALREKADEAFGRRNAFLWGALGVWAVGLVDAYVFGVDGERAAGGLALVPAGAGAGAGVALAGTF